MDLGTFYALFSATSFTLVGLWWNVVERRPTLTETATGRRLAGGVYLSFLLPGLMSLFAQISPGQPAMWRTSFGIVAVIGILSTYPLVRAGRDVADLGVFSRHRWIVIVLYAVILVLGMFPALATPLGLAPIQVAAILLVLLIVIAHGLTWELLVSRTD